MIGFLMNVMAGPVIILAMCGSAICLLWLKCRNVRCCKRLIRWVEGHGYEDSWLTIVVHEVKTEVQDLIQVSCRCGSHFANTSSQPPTSRGVFQEGLVLLVPEGEDDVQFELLANSDVIAKLSLSFAKHIMQNNIVERTLKMKSRARGVSNVTITLTLIPTVEEDGVDPEDPPEVLDVEWLVERQMTKLRDDLAQTEHVDAEAVSEMHLLLQVTHGPLDKLSGMGNRQACYFAVISPPDCERWTLGIWYDRKGWEANQNPDIAIDMMKVQSVMADPDQVSTFAIKYYDEQRRLTEQRFRRIDRSRDVWVESLQKLIHAVREQKRAEKADKAQGKKRSSKDKEEKAQASAKASAKTASSLQKSAPGASSTSRQASSSAGDFSAGGTAASNARSVTLKKTSSKK